MKPRLFLLAGAFALAATILPAAAQSNGDRMIALAGATQLTIDVRDGDLDAVADPLLKVVEVHVENSGVEPPMPAIAVEHAGRVLSLALSAPNHPVLPFAGGHGHVFLVHYPPALRLRVKQAEGAVTIESPRASVEIYSASGGITVTSPRAAVAAEADNGNLRVSDATQSLSLTAGNGNVHAALAAGWAGRLIRLEATTGNLHLQVPPGFRGKYDLSTGRGTVSNPLQSNGGSPLVFMLTETGNASVSVENL